MTATEIIPMSENLYRECEKLLSSCDKFVSDGRIIRNSVLESANKLDSTLIKALLSHSKFKAYFFADIDGVYVFDKVKFIDFISNKEFLPDSYTAYSNKIGLRDGNTPLQNKKDVVLTWAYKDCILEGGQDKDDSKRQEIFYNTTLAPDHITRLLHQKVLTKFSYWDKEAVENNQYKPVTDINQSQNLLVKGNNLLALHTIKHKYAGKVKLIYIDPPYNTGGDSFKYNDNFNHSTWLTFMKNRLEVAKDLLSDDGVFCVHCDDNEFAYLKILMDEIFERENFINSVSIRDSHASGLKLSSKERTIIKTKSMLLLYKKNIVNIYPQYIKRDDWDTHFNIFIDIDAVPLLRKSLKDIIIEEGIVEEGFILDSASLKNKKFKDFVFKNRRKIFQSTKEIPLDIKQKSLDSKDTVIEYFSTNREREFAFNGRRLSPLSKSIVDVGFDGAEQKDFGKLACDFWDDIDFNNTQNEGDVVFPNGKKPEKLLARIISLFTKNNDLVLDFFSGSGTTPAVAHKMGRRWIAIEQMGYIRDLPEARLKKVVGGEQGGISKAVNWQGGGDFIYLELMQWNDKFIPLVKDATDTSTLLSLYEDMKKSEYFRYDFDKSKWNEQEFSKLTLDEQKKLLLDLLNYNHLYVLYDEIDDIDYKVSDSDKALNHQFYKN